MKAEISTSRTFRGSPIVPTGPELGPSQRARDLARLLKFLPAEVRLQFRELLEQSLAHPSVAERRDGRIGLMVRMIVQRQGRPVGRLEYDDEQRLLKSRGEVWPTSSQLISAYLSWEVAVRISLRFVRKGSAARVPADLKHAARVEDRREPLSWEAVVLTVVRYFHENGAWPDEGLFYDWIETQRIAARATGGNVTWPELPSRKQITRYFRGFPDLLAAAQDYERRQAEEPVPNPSGRPRRHRVRRVGRPEWHDG